MKIPIYKTRNFEFQLLKFQNFQFQNQDISNAGNSTSEFQGLLAFEVKGYRFRASEITISEIQSF